jgi:hypothetical protein
MVGETGSKPSSSDRTAGSSWRMYTSVVSIGAAFAALLGWLISVGTNTEAVLKGRVALSTWLAPTKIALELRDPYASHITKPIAADEALADWKLYLNIVADKTGDDELTGCERHLSFRGGKERLGFGDDDIAVYSFPRGSAQQLLSFWFFVPPGWEEETGSLRIVCTGLVSKWVPIPVKLAK